MINNFKKFINESNHNYNIELFLRIKNNLPDGFQIKKMGNDIIILKNHLMYYKWDLKNFTNKKVIKEVQKHGTKDKILKSFKNTKIIDELWIGYSKINMPIIRSVLGIDRNDKNIKTINRNQNYFGFKDVEDI